MATLEFGEIDKRLPSIEDYRSMPSQRDAQFIEAFKALSDPTRLRILRLLKQKGHCSLGKEEGMCARDIEDRIKLTQPTISHHMSILKKAGLVHAEKQGLWMWYRRNEKSLRQLAAGLGDL
jgi:ArsR family transcriptional regulator